MRTILRFFARFLPLPGARECRVPGWRPTGCDTARLSMHPRFSQHRNPIDTCPACLRGIRAHPTAAPPAGEGRE